MSNEKRYTVEAFKSRLTEAFKALRSQGIVARQNFSCCGGCACAELAGYLADHPEKRGAAYYHKQDAEGIDPIRPSRRRFGAGHYQGANGVHLGFGARPEQDADNAATVAVGREVVAALQAAGLIVEWNGTAAERIWVDGAEPTEPKSADEALGDAFEHFISDAAVQS